MNACAGGIGLLEERAQIVRDAGQVVAIGVAVELQSCDVIDVVLGRLEDQAGSRGRALAEPGGIPVASTETATWVPCPLSTSWRHRS